jgi:HTH-type transcriptional regulator / antitoxin HigA
MTRTDGRGTVSNMTATVRRYSPKKYGKLLVDALPGVIMNDEDYNRTEAIFSKLMDKGENRLSLEESKLFALLAKLLEDYEARALPPLDRTSPTETLSFLMEQNDLRQEDLADIFGSQGGVSKAITGKRAISKAQAKRLAERFRVSTDAFI